MTDIMNLIQDLLNHGFNFLLNPLLTRQEPVLFRQIPALVALRPFLPCHIPCHPGPSRGLSCNGEGKPANFSPERFLPETVRHLPYKIIDQQIPYRIINNLEERTSSSAQLLLREGIRANLTVPIMIKERLFGFLFFAHRKPQVYT